MRPYQVRIEGDGPTGLGKAGVSAQGGELCSNPETPLIDRMRLLTRQIQVCTEAR